MECASPDAEAGPVNRRLAGASGARICPAPLYFASGSSALPENAGQALKSVVQSLGAHPHAHVAISGFHDGRHGARQPAQTATHHRRHRSGQGTPDRNPHRAPMTRTAPVGGRVRVGHPLARAAFPAQAARGPLAQLVRAQHGPPSRVLQGTIWPGTWLRRGRSSGRASERRDPCASPRANRCSQGARRGLRESGCYINAFFPCVP